jgi:hypothetical protein
MKGDTKGLFWRGARLAAASVLASTMLAGGNSALASGGNDSKFVSGNSTYSDCGLDGSDFALLMTGDLEGCLSVFVQGFTCKELPDYDLLHERGREVFVGKLNGKQGRFRTTYTFDAAYAKGFCQTFDPSLEVGGGCTHKVEGRSGIFENASGLIKFIDVIAGVTGDPVTGAFTAGTGGNNFLYYGRIHLD